MRRLHKVVKVVPDHPSRGKQDRAIKPSPLALLRARRSMMR
jgi:hypothetical protein